MNVDCLNHLIKYVDYGSCVYLFITCKDLYDISQFTNSGIMAYFRDKLSRKLTILGKKISLQNNCDSSPINMPSGQTMCAYIKSNDIGMMHFLSYLVPLDKMTIPLRKLIVSLCAGGGGLGTEFVHRLGLQHMSMSDADCFLVNVSIFILAYLFGKTELIECVRDTIDKKYSIRHLKLFSIVPGTSPSSDEISRFTVDDLGKNESCISSC